MNMRFLLVATAMSPILSSTILPSAAFAQTDPCDKAPPQDGEPLCVDITSFRMEKPAKFGGSSVSVITQQDMQRRGDRSAADALKRVPGVSLARNGGIGATSQIRIRGSEPGQVRVLIDGVSVNDPSSANNEFDFASLMITDIQRIEVLRGPQSSLYGPDAMGGVINIITIKGPKNNGWRGFAEGGTFQTFSEGLSYRGGDEGLYYGVSGQHFKTDGFSRVQAGDEKDGSSIADIKANLGGKILDNLSVDFSGGYSDADLEFDPSPTRDGIANQDRTVIFGQAQATLDLLDNRLRNTLKVGANQTEREFDEPSSTSNRYSTFTGMRSQASYQADLKIGARDVVTAGVEFQRDDSKTTSTNNVGVYRVNVDRTLDNKAIFAQYLLGATDAWTITAAGRHDDNEQFGTANTYRVTTAYDVALTGTVLRASVGSGFKAPTLFQLYAPTFGTASLEAEKSVGFDVGFDQNFLSKRLNISSTYFRNEFENLIIFDTGTNNYQNVPDANTWGIENSVTFWVLPELMLGGNYTYLRSEQETTGRQLQRRPRHTATLTADYDISSAARVGGQWRYVSSQLDNASGSRTIQPYSLFDLTGSYDFHQNYTVYARLENVLNKDYEEAARFNAPGRAVYVGIRGRY